MKGVFDMAILNEFLSLPPSVDRILHIFGSLSKKLF
jgi:hypothetical protein